MQNTNKCFNGTIWERIPNNTSVSLPNCEFGIFDVLANFNIGMKAAVLFYEKLNFASDVYMLRGCKTHRLKRVSLSNQQLTQKIN